MAFFVVIRGPAGVGKTAVAKKLSKEIGAEYISLDEVLHTETELKRKDTGSIPEENWKEVNEIIIPEANKILASVKNVVFDGNFYHKKYLNNLLKRMNSKGYVFTLKASVKTCLEREEKRSDKYRIGEKEIKAVHKLTSRFDKGIVIETDHKTITEVLNEIKKYLGV